MFQQRNKAFEVCFEEQELHTFLRLYLFQVINGSFYCPGYIKYFFKTSETFFEHILTNFGVISVSWDIN
uniref:Uncharacterized protein n=1 Tax=Lepeophtheirus salmonis TaxID=72036 RepID=A0A0K2U1U6_LEPSM